jgi:single-strand DNA-binding protein
MTDSITVTGVVGSDPRLHVTTQGLAITSFRLATTRRYFDRAKGTWEDGETNWYTVSGFRQLAHNTAASVLKGERVVVHGRLRLRAWESGEKSGTAVEIEADSIGHDLSWGITRLTKVRVAREAAAEGEPTHETGAEAGGWPGVSEPVTSLGESGDDVTETASSSMLEAEKEELEVVV